MLQGLLVTYLLGVAIGLWRGHAPLSERAGLALAWPLAPVACAVTLALLAAAAVVLFPLIGVLAAAAVGLAFWWLS